MKDLVEQFLANEVEVSETATFKEMPSFGYAIERAGMAVNDVGKRYSHQYRLKLDPLKAATKELRSRAAEMTACSSFEELHTILQQISGQIRGLGPLYAYDTALRLGANRGLLPNRVYLHAGTKAGARALKLDYRQASLPLEAFPKALQRLSPDMIESFLCIYKDQLGDALL